jgi:NAD(P)-dependent dehydrogenase (short-subunit alcohol dehydrogenase family)
MISSQTKTALITGAAGDIGQALATSFLQHGYRLILSDSRSKELLERASHLPSGQNLAVIPANLAEVDDVLRLSRELLERNGSVDVIVNNAAVQPDGDVLACDLPSFETCYAVNLRAPYVLCRELVPSMVEKGGGSIINIASVHAAAPGPRRFAYSTMKTALLGMTRSMAVDLGHLNIRANVISPTATLTSQLRDAWTERSSDGIGEDLISYASRQHPLGRLADVTDVADAAIFLAQSRFISGIELRVDGGLLSALRILPPDGHAEPT